MFRYFFDYLTEWRNQPARTPLIVRGPRQVGKSYTIREFGRGRFRNLCEVNLELEPRILGCFQSRNADEICRQLEVILKQDIVDGETLLFIDEIQGSCDALIALRAFKENRPGLHVIAAGSLLEFALQEDKNFSFPVGRVSFSHMHPMSFWEFLLALGEDKAAQMIAECSIEHPCSRSVHEHLLGLVRKYYMIGGMPEVVDTYRTTQSMRTVMQVQTRLMQAFFADFSKYGRRYDYRRLQTILAAVPRMVGRQFKFSHVDPESKARDLKQPLFDLELAGLIRLVRASHASASPLAAEERDGIFKVQMLDIGLMLNSLGLEGYSLPIEEFLFANEGALAEQFVGQEILAQSLPDQLPRMHYWAREKKGSEAEVDFVKIFAGRVIPVEVKAGATGTLRSLRLFMKEKSAPVGLRISLHPLSFVDGILSVPFYMIRETPRLLAACF